ncbi:hypothetical protein, partial [Anaplasma bovis]|uniref:hypothetical protein n=1 Tax=Anaplasma bovis TaxID=186733 RepID=UPI002FF0A7ED
MYFLVDGEFMGKLFGCCCSSNSEDKKDADFTAYSSDNTAVQEANDSDSSSNRCGSGHGIGGAAINEGGGDLGYGTQGGTVSSSSEVLNGHSPEEGATALVGYDAIYAAISHGRASAGLAKVQSSNRSSTQEVQEDKSPSVAALVGAFSSGVSQGLTGAHNKGSDANEHVESTVSSSKQKAQDSVKRSGTPAAFMPNAKRGSSASGGPTKVQSSNRSSTQEVQE